MTIILTIVLNVVLLAAIVYMVCSTAAERRKQKQQINVFIDETNKIAVVAPQVKASAEDIECLHQNLTFTYDEVIMVAPKVKIKGAYRK